jgi:hypothetical protein
MAVKYRILKRDEKVKRGDQFLNRSGVWLNSDNWPGVQAPEYKYRRPIRVESRKPARNTLRDAIALVRSEIKRLGWDCADVSTTLCVLKQIEQRHP